MKKMSENKVIDLARARELVAEQVAKKGEDFVYAAPAEMKSMDGYAGFYNHAPGDAKAVPGCLFGHMFDDLGVLDRVSEGASPGPILQGMGWDVSKQALMYMSSVQSRQDSGTAWGEAAVVSDKSVNDDVEFQRGRIEGFDERETVR